MRRPVKKAPPQQGNLFDEPVQASASEMLRIDRSSQRLGPQQRAFNRLTAQLERLRAELPRWEEAGQRLCERVLVELAPLEQESRALMRELVLAIDALLLSPSGRKLSKRRRAGLQWLLLSSCETLLALSGSAAPDAELEAIHDRYADISLAEQRKLESEWHQEMLRDLSRDVLDEDLPDRELEAEEINALKARIDERLAAMEAAEEEAWAREAAARQARRPGARQRAEAAEQRKRAAAAEIQQSVREIYRKLAASLHPDREPDPAERARKTGLMQKLNAAYEAGDLLTLLTLQIELEQIDSSRLAELPEQRLAHYNAVLREQVQALRAEIDQRRAALAELVGAEPGERILEVRDLDALLQRHISELRAEMQRHRDLIAALADPLGCQPLLDEIASEYDQARKREEREQREWVCDSLLDAALAEIHGSWDPWAEPATPRQRKRRRR
jgi:hypothetical protein